MQKTGGRVRRRAHHRIDHERHGEVEHSRSVEHRPDLRAVDVEIHRVIVPQDSDLADIPARQIRLKHPEILGNIFIHPDDVVAVAEAKLDT